MSQLGEPAPTASDGARRELVVEQLSKSYGPTRALDRATFRIGSNSIIGVVGANGAGKSTLVRLLSGEEREDEGKVLVDGEPWGLERRAGLVAVVHQEPQLFPNLTVGENVMISSRRLLRPKPGPEALAVLDRLGIVPFVNVGLDRCSIVVWQLTEIARALLRRAEIFLFDEPNSALTKKESEQLFEQLELLKSPEHFIFLVSHRLAEVARVCDEVVVMRDGTNVAVLSSHEVSSESLTRQLLHEEIDASVDELRRETSGAATEGESLPARPVATAGAPRGAAPTGGAATGGAATGGAATGGAGGGGAPLDDVIAGRLVPVPGVVLAVTGPEGGGGRELVRAAWFDASARHGRTGQPTLAAYISADRRDSLFFNMSVAANIASRGTGSACAGRLGFLGPRAIRIFADPYVARMKIKTERPGSPVGSLSGGNQQKVVLAAALAVEPDLLIAEEPTRGVDLNTKREIYVILREFVAAGGAVVLFVTELEDAMACADRIFAVRDGEIAGAVDIEGLRNLEDLGVLVNSILDSPARSVA